MQPKTTDLDKRGAALSRVVQAWVGAASAVCQACKSASSDIDEATLISLVSFDDAISRYKRAVKKHWSNPESQVLRQAQARIMPTDLLMRTMFIDAVRWDGVWAEADSENVLVFRYASATLTDIFASAQQFAVDVPVREAFSRIATEIEDQARSVAARVQQQV